MLRLVDFILIIFTIVLTTNRFSSKRLNSEMLFFHESKEQRPNSSLAVSLLIK